MAWGVMVVALEWVQRVCLFSLFVGTDCAWLCWLLLCTLHYHRLPCSNLEPLPPCPVSSRTIPPPPPPPPPSPPLPLPSSLFSRVHVPALAPTLERSLPCGHRQTGRRSRSLPPAPPSPPTASSPPPAAPCDALPAFLLCPASAPQRALRNETTPPRPRLYLRLREQLRPLANAAVSIPTPA